MNAYNRREFFERTGGLLGGMMLAGGMLGCGGNQAQEQQTSAMQPPNTHFRYAMCNESMQDRSWEEQCRIIGNAGYEGVEIATFTLVEEGVQELSAAERTQMVNTMNKHGIECAGLHWLLAPPPKGLHFTHPDPARRKEAIAYLNELIDFCGDLGGEVMAFGSPGQRSSVEGQSTEAATENFGDGLAQVADHAAERNVKVLIEPLSTEQTDVVNTMSEAMELVREIGHPAISTMFDFHNTADETEPLHVLIEKYYDHIDHVHIQEMDGRHLGTGNAVNDFVEEYEVLYEKRYNKWISLEVFDFEPGGETIANESMSTLKKLEQKVVEA